MDSGPLGDSTSFLAGGGEMGALMRAKDWSQSPLGAPCSASPSNPAGACASTPVSAKAPPCGSTCRARARPRASPRPGEPTTPLPDPLDDAWGILLVDDDHGVREVTAAMLREMGHVVIEAGSGGHALELLEQQPSIDLMLIDFAMPGMNGAELARQAPAKRPGLPMIFLTGYADAALGDTDEDHIIRKPFRDGDLVAKIRRVLETQTPSGGEKTLASRPRPAAQSP